MARNFREVKGIKQGDFRGCPGSSGDFRGCQEISGYRGLHGSQRRQGN